MQVVYWCAVKQDLKLFQSYVVLQDRYSLKHDVNLAVTGIGGISYKYPVKQKITWSDLESSQDLA